MNIKHEIFLIKPLSVVKGPYWASTMLSHHAVMSLSLVEGSYWASTMLSHHVVVSLSLVEGPAPSVVAGGSA